MAFIP